MRCQSWQIIGAFVVGLTLQLPATAEWSQDAKLREHEPAGEVEAHAASISRALEDGGSENNDCGSCCGDGCCRPVCRPCCLPTWQVRAGVLFLDRESPKSGPFLVAASTAPGQIGARNLTTVADYSTFNFDMRPGFEIGVIRNLNCCWGIEARYFQIDKWNDSFTLPVLGQSQTFVQYANGGVFGTGAGVGDSSTASSVYGSDLLSFELNVRRRIGCRLTGLAGFRYMKLDEALSVSIVNVTSGEVSSQRFSTNNDLFGFQLGAEGLLYCCGNLKIDGFGKAGIYTNGASNRLETTNRGQANIDRNVTRSESATALVAEAGLNGSYCLTSCLAIRGGYQILYLSEVAIADSQPRVNQNVGPVSNLAFDSLFYHGANLALEFRR